MEGVRQWAAAVCICCVLVGMVRMLLPEGSDTQVINMVLTVYIIVSVLSPVQPIGLAELRQELDLAETFPAADWKALAGDAASARLTEQVDWTLQEKGLEASAQVTVTYGESGICAVTAAVRAAPEDWEEILQVMREQLGQEAEIRREDT